MVLLNLILNQIYQRPRLALFCLGIIVLWDLVWRGLALWYSGKNQQKAWFIALLVLNTIGILPIIYLVWFKPNERIRKKLSKNRKK